MLRRQTFIAAGLLLAGNANVVSKHETVAAAERDERRRAAEDTLPAVKDAIVQYRGTLKPLCSFAAAG